jgi:hypothetical protein
MQLKKHTLNLREGDYEYLTSLFEPQGLKTAHVIRNIIARTVDGFRENESKIDFSLGVEE